MQKDLSQIREEIDQVDRQLVELFCRRMAISSEVAAYKQQNGLPITDPARERAVLNKAAALAQPPFQDYTRILYGTLFDLSKAYQASLSPKSSALAGQIRKAAEQTPPLFPQSATVACQGVEGAYSQMACDKLFQSPDIVYVRSFEGVVQAVQQGLCEFGVLPIENSSYGSVNAVYDLMKRYDFHIVRSVRLHIDHNLLALPGVKLEEIREIVSHEQAIGQCSGFLSRLAGVKVTVCANTAMAAQMVAQSGRRDLAAISSHNCAALYGLQVLDEHIQDSENNYTRFICIAPQMRIYPGADRISLMFSVPHQPGTLHGVLSKFAALGLNLTKLESRPIVGSDFEFMFYADFTASVWSDQVLGLLGSLAAGNGSLVFLGSYSEV